MCTLQSAHFQVKHLPNIPNLIRHTCLYVPLGVVGPACASHSLSVSGVFAYVLQWCIAPKIKQVTTKLSYHPCASETVGGHENTFLFAYGVGEVCL